MIRVELYRQLRRLRTFIALGALMALPLIVAIAEHTSGPESDASLEERTIYAVSSASAINHAVASLTFMSQFFLVVVVAQFASDALAAESTWGSLRYLLMRPVARTKLVLSKAFVLLILALVAVLAIVVSGLVSGTIFFGWGRVLAPGFSTSGTGIGLARLGLASIYVVVNMTGIMALALFVTTFTSSASGATGAAISFTIVSQILGALPSLESLRPVLVTRYWLAWTNLFAGGGSNGMLKGVALQTAYVTIFGGLALWRFRRKDILT